jgi:hypothetical protein
LLSSKNCIRNLHYVVLPFFAISGEIIGPITVANLPDIETIGEQVEKGGETAKVKVDFVVSPIVEK